MKALPWILAVAFLLIIIWLLWNKTPDNTDASIHINESNRKTAQITLLKSKLYLDSVSHYREMDSLVKLSVPDKINTIKQKSGITINPIKYNNQIVYLIDSASIDSLTKIVARVPYLENRCNTQDTIIKLADQRHTADSMSIMGLQADVKTAIKKVRKAKATSVIIGGLSVALIITALIHP